MQMKNTKWMVPLFALLMGGVYLVALWLGGELGAGMVAFGIMAAFAALLLLGGRGEIVRVLRGQHTDEMWKSFDVRATLFMSFVLIVVIIGAAVYEMARGQDAQPYALLGFISGVSYVAALIWLRLRS